MSYSLDPDQAQRFVVPDLGQICSQRLSAENTKGKELERRSSLRPLKVFLMFNSLYASFGYVFLYLTGVWLVIIMNLKIQNNSLKAILT